MKVLILSIVVFLASCNSNHNADLKYAMDFGPFKMQTFAGWKMVREKGIDTYVGAIAIDSTDTLYFDMGVLAKQTDFPPGIVELETIDGKKARIVHPVNSGHGTTQIYIDSLWGGPPNSCFNLYGDDLKPENEKLALEAFKTLKFHKE